MRSSVDTWARRVCVYKAHGPADGHLIRDLLEAEGIPVQMRGELLSSLQGAIPVPDAWPSLWVRPHNATRARQLIDDMDQPADATDWACACGEVNGPGFGSCWQCGAAQPRS